jgi:hypothetical protein
MQYKLIVLLVGCLSIISNVYAGPYISPGAQVGYTFGRGVFFSFQATVGYLFVDQRFSMGATLGTKSYYQGNKTTYLDAQYFSMRAGVGVGVGKQRDWFDHHPSGISALKLKAWSAYTLFPVPNYEVSMSEGDVEHSLGAFLLFPIMSKDDYGEFIKVE